MTENSIPDKKTIVLYIASPGRSGSTLMERVFNEIPNVFAAGGVGNALKRGALFDEENKARCLCGQKVGQCPVWGKIINDVNFKKIDKNSFQETHAKYHKVKNFLKIFWKKKQNLPLDLKQYLDDLQTLYNVIQTNQGAQIITDSTLLPLHGYYLSLMPSIDLYVVQLVRDPRGVVYSWNRVKCTSKNVPWSPKISLLQATFSWIKKNGFIQFLFSRKKGKYLRIHYEDFIKNPTQTIKEIEELLGIELKSSHFLDKNVVQLGENHMIGGNIDATKTGEIVLKLDERWKREMKWWDVALTTLITSPLLLKYSIVDKMIKKKRI